MRVNKNSARLRLVETKRDLSHFIIDKKLQQLFLFAGAHWHAMCIGGCFSGTNRLQYSHPGVNSYHTRAKRSRCKSLTYQYHLC